MLCEGPDKLGLNDSHGDIQTTSVYPVQSFTGALSLEPALGKGPVGECLVTGSDQIQHKIVTQVCPPVDSPPAGATGVWCVVDWEKNLVVKDSIKLNESHGAWQACRTLEQLTVTGGPTTCRWSGRSSVIVWNKTFSRPRRNSGKPFGDSRWRSSPHCGGELLTSNGDIVEQRKEYVKDLLNPTNMSSLEQVEQREEEKVDLSHTSRYEAIVLTQKKVDCGRVEEFKFFRVLFTGLGWFLQQIRRYTGPLWQRES